MTNVIRKLNNINFICFDFLSLILCIFSLPLTTTIYYRNRTFRPGISKLKKIKLYLMIVEWNLNLSQAGFFHLVYFTKIILARKYRKRAILKNGECNIVQSKLSQKRLRYLQDAFTTFVDTQVSFFFFITYRSLPFVKIFKF